MLKRNISKWFTYRFCLRISEKTYLDDLNSELGLNAVDGLGGRLGLNAGLLKSWVETEFTVGDTRDGLLHDDHGTGAGTANVDNELSRSRNIANLELNADEVTGGGRGSTLIVAALLALDLAVQAVDGGGDIGLHLGSGLLPVLDTSVSVTESLDASNALRGIQLTLGVVERSKSR